MLYRLRFHLLCALYPSVLHFLLNQNNTFMFRSLQWSMTMLYEFALSFYLHFGIVYSSFIENSRINTWICPKEGSPWSWIYPIDPGGGSFLRTGFGEGHPVTFWHSLLSSSEIICLNLEYNMFALAMFQICPNFGAFVGTWEMLYLQSAMDWWQRWSTCQ